MCYNYMYKCYCSYPLLNAVTNLPQLGKSKEERIKLPDEGWSTVDFWPPGR